MCVWSCRRNALALLHTMHCDSFSLSLWSWTFKIHLAKRAHLFRNSLGPRAYSAWFFLTSILPFSQLSLQQTIARPSRAETKITFRYWPTLIQLDIMPHVKAKFTEKLLHLARLCCFFSLPFYHLALNVLRWMKKLCLTRYHCSSQPKAPRSALHDSSLLHIHSFHCGKRLLALFQFKF